LKIAGLLDGRLYYQRWSDALAIDHNIAFNGGHVITGVRWYTNDGTYLGDKDYIPIQGPKTGYYAEVQTGGEWHRVCHTATRSPEQITVYPNPVPRGENVTLQLPEPYINSVLNIYSITGSLVKSGVPLPSAVNSIDVSGHAPGIYLLQVVSGNGNRQTLKIIIE
jgi:hypothetical protein